MSTRSKKKIPVTPPPEPERISMEGFSAHKTPNPTGSFFSGLPPGPRVSNGSVDVYRYRVTVERIEEPREVVLGRMVDLWRNTTNHHHHTALAGEARRRFGVDLYIMAQEADKAAIEVREVPLTEEERAGLKTNLERLGAVR